MKKIETKTDLTNFFTDIIESNTKFDIDGIALLNVILKNNTLISFDVNDKNLVSVSINVGGCYTSLSFFSYDLTKLIWNTQVRLRDNRAIDQLNVVLSSLQ